jgi:hypothetical protein
MTDDNEPENNYVITEEYSTPTIVIGRTLHTIYETNDEEYYNDYYDEKDLENSNSIVEMCEIYSDIFYCLKRFISSAYMPYLDNPPEFDQMSDFFTMMDNAYGD